MRRIADYLPVRVGVLVFLALTLFVSVMRPLTRPTGHLYTRSGVTRMSLLTEPGDDEDADVSPSADTTDQVLQPFVFVGVLLLVLKTRRVAFRPLRVRRVKRPPRRPANALLSDPLVA
jgi:hypothetical protein